MTSRLHLPLVAAGLVVSMMMVVCSTPRSPHAQLAAALREPLVFRWTEVVPAGAESSPSGGVAFVARGAGIYSVAWPDPDSGRTWPAVFGIGRREGLRLVVDYRTLVPDPSHDFYRAECRFEIAADLGGFRCEYRQRADPQTVELMPGEATGTRESPAEEAVRVETLLYRLRELGVEGLGRSAP